MEEYNLNIFQVVGSEIGVSSEKGNEVFRKIDTAIQNDKAVILDFNNLKIITTAFLNSAIGQLYSKYNSNQLKKSLSITNITDSDKLLLKKVTDRAKEYFADKENIDSIIEDAIRDE